MKSAYVARAKPRRQPRAVVGRRVGVPVAGRMLAGAIVEDWGALGVHGERVVRVRVQDPILPDEHFDIEVPLKWLHAPPRRPGSLMPGERR